MLDAGILKILRCPESSQPFQLADEKMVAEINGLISAGSLLSVNGKTVTEKIDGGLLREDGKVLYPVRHGLPILLVDEGIQVMGGPG